MRRGYHISQLSWDLSAWYVYHTDDYGEVARFYGRKARAYASEHAKRLSALLPKERP